MLITAIGRRLSTDATTGIPMSQSILLYLNERPVATLQDLRVETPWSTAQARFLDAALGDALERVARFRTFDEQLEALDLPEDEEEARWEAKLAELGLTHADLGLDFDGQWSVVLEDGPEQEVRSIRFEDGVLQWRG
ncbi:hypothetical protein [Stenotrophomonas sp.]|uniref:hypothetical protein n=1 Tax=Stenotrophomonas sp. TaxID=69392 RepID=UPI00289A5EE3|nr:hypothetical protein [Stenotrophomonas sp.]